MTDDPRPQSRPNNRETEHENQRPAGDGKPPRPATEPKGSEGSSDSGKTETDPGSGEQ
ncbi:MAG: hypothetical protein JWR84_393 [Caulobacter sp.]|nr:hypothetical protein [Caulobacter sp.]